MSDGSEEATSYAPVDLVLLIDPAKKFDFINQDFPSDAADAPAKTVLFRMKDKVSHPTFGKSGVFCRKLADGGERPASG